MVFLADGDLPALAGWSGTVAYIPCLAQERFMFGSRVFDVVYVIWWDMGLPYKTQRSDFTAGDS